MAVAQTGIFAQGTRSHYHLELDVDPGAEATAVVDALRGLQEPAVTAGGANLVVGFGAALARRLALPGGVPAALADFTAIEGIDAKTAPATQHDLWVWIHGTGEDVALDIARAVVGALAGVASVAVDQPCFVFKDSRDLTGFVDGTANPPVGEAPEVATVPDGEPGAGGAFVLAQRWVHDLTAFESLAVADQERVIGRTKADSVELDDEAKPANAHIARVEIEGADGAEIEIYRRSTPFGTVGEHGLYFLAFSADPGRFTLMLERMFGRGDDGIRDRLTDFSRPVTGAFYFAPSLETLNDLVG
jgi:putative iron-dependent peroxidase